jgi:hypothetical protein
MFKFITLSLFTLVLLAGCKSKRVFCLGFPKDIMGWFPNTENQSLHFMDQNGNDTTIVLSKAEYDKPYSEIQSHRTFAKQVKCTMNRQLSSGPDGSIGLKVSVSGESTGRESIRTPDNYNFHVTIGQPGFHNPGFYFTILKDGGAAIEDIRVAHESNYTVNNITYDEVMICEDTPGNNNSNLEQLIYARNKGIVSFTTKAPHNTWILQ